jgi:hypothetical protein
LLTAGVVPEVLGVPVAKVNMQQKMSPNVLVTGISVQNESAVCAGK